MTLPKFQHKPVLFQQAIDALNLHPDGLYIDGTFGRGGHTAEILKHLGANGRLIAFDKDPEAIAFGEAKFSGDARFQLVQASFADMPRVLSDLGCLGEVDAVLLDLGVSSPQLDDAERGFSFLRDGPLDMRMNPDAGMSAADWLAEASEQAIIQVIKGYGEEKFGTRIARAILTFRAETPILTTAVLAQIIDEAVPVKDKFKHPATRSFQAIRIFINQELDDLQQFLDSFLPVLKSKGRLAVIAFHSLEDRKVKRCFRRLSKGAALPKSIPLREDQIHLDVRLIGKAIKANAQELQDNPRARSAVMRVVEKLA